MFDLTTSSIGGLSGATFNFVYGVGVPLNQSNLIVATANRVGAEWSGYLKDNVTLNIQIEFVDLPDPIIGGTRPAMIKVNYKDFVAALFDDKTSEQDWTALNNLQLNATDRDTLLRYNSGTLDDVKFTTKDFSLYLDSRFNQSSSGQGGLLDSDGDDNNQKIWLTRANAKALNLLKSNDRKLDAVIQLDDSIAWDFNPGDGITPGTYDFSTVLKHEIGHALGVVSGVDAFEFLTLTRTTSLSDKDLTYVTPMDMFRYSPESALVGVPDLRIGGGVRKYFSLDGGRTILADFSIGSISVGGDGYQSSHWQNSNQPLGIMNPSLQPGQSLTISQLDLQLIDDIGWDLVSPLATKARAVGLDWDQLGQQLSQHQQTTITSLATSWDSKNPGYSIQSDLVYETHRLNFKLNRNIEKEINELTRKLSTITDAKKRTEEIQNSLKDIWELQRKQSEKLTEFVKVREKLDERVRKWLNLTPDKLAGQLEIAIGVEFLKLADLVRNAPLIQRVTWEFKLFNAFLYLTDKPGKAVEELLKTTGPGNPIGWRGTRFWSWFQTADDTSVNLLFQANSDSLASPYVSNASLTDPLTGLSLS